MFKLNFFSVVLLLLTTIFVVACQESAPPLVECTDAIGCVTIAPNEPVKLGIIQDLSGSALAFGLIFLISDPVSSATTDPGRWIYGALGGALIVVFSPVAGVTTEAVVFSALMASVFAPLIDHLVVLAHTRRKAGRLA